MALWLWIVLGLAGAFLLLLFLFRVHYRFDWNGGLDVSGSFDYGIPGFKRVWKFPSNDDGADSQPEESDPVPAGAESRPASKKRSFSIKKLRRVLSLFITDRALGRALLAYGFRCVRLTFKLLRLELDFALSHSDPAQLGRLAGYWYAARPFIPTRRVNLEFRFQDPKFSLQLHARGGFSAAQALAYLMALIASFPWFHVARKALRRGRNS